MSTNPGNSIQPLNAELLARHVSTAYANTCSYGHEHPLTQKACRQAHAYLGDALAREPVITLLSDRGSLYVEKHPVGSRFDPKRLVKMFAAMGIESITFEAGIILDDFQRLMHILANPESFASLDRIEAELSCHHVDSVRFNHIVYRKLTSDQKVVSKEDERAAADGPSRYAAGAAARVLHELEDFMSLSRMAGNPEAAGSQLAESVAQSDETARGKLIEHLRNLAREIESGGTVGASSLSPEDLFLAMNTLRQRVRQSISARQDMETVLAEQGEFITEVDQLTYSTLISLVREEYRSSDYSARRMAQVINRMLPDPQELRRMLPQLKQALIREGMSLRAYGELIHHLSTGLRGERLVQALESGADRIGLDVDEIVDRIQDDPTEAARLVVLAAELRQGSINDGEQLSAAFSDYIERMSRKLEIEEATETERLDPHALGEQLSRIQRELVIGLGDRGLQGESVAEINGQLHRQVEKAVDDSRLMLLSSLLERSASLSADTVMEWLEQQLLTPSDLDRMRGPVGRIMQQHGFDAEQVAEIFEVFAEKLPDGPPVTLPERVLSPEHTRMFLDREVLCARRYSTPFCVIRVTIDRLHFPTGISRRATPRELCRILPELYTRMIRQARDPDLIGSLDEYLSAEPLLILPMTDDSGAKIVGERVERLLPEYPFELGQTSCQITITTTSIAYDADRHLDSEQFLMSIEQRHETRRYRASVRGTDAPAASRV